MTYNVPIGALNSTIPYHTVLLKWLQTKLHCYQATRATKNKPRQLSLWQSNNSPTAVPKVSLKNQETFPNIMRTGRGGSRISEWGAQVERRRREYRGAAGAEGVEFGEGVSPSPMGEGDTPIFWRPIFLNFRPGMLHFEANFRQLTRPVAISLKPARSCVVASQPVKSLECHRQTKDRKVEVDLSCCRLKISLTTNHNISDD